MAKQQRIGAEKCILAECWAEMRRVQSEGIFERERTVQRITEAKERKYLSSADAKTQLLLWACGILYRILEI